MITEIVKKNKADVYQDSILNAFGFLTNEQKIVFFLWSKYFDNCNIFSEDVQRLLNIKKSYASSLLSELEKSGKIYREDFGIKKRIYLTESWYANIQSFLSQLGCI